MTTLNARANAAYNAMVDEAPDGAWFGFSHERDAYETGWEDGYKAARQEAGPERVGGEGSARTEELGMACHTVADERQQVLGTCLPAADPVPTDLINLVLAFQQIQEKAITSVEKLRIQDCIDAARRIYGGGQ